MFCFWWNLSRPWEDFKLIVGWPIPLGVLVISFDLSWSLLLTFILADAFFHSCSCSTGTASTKTIKMPMKHFLPGCWVKIFVIPKDVILTWLSCLHLTLCCWKTFHFSAQSTSLHFFCKKGRFWAFHVACGGCSGGLDLYLCYCRVNSGFATTAVQPFLLVHCSSVSQIC